MRIISTSGSHNGMPLAMHARHYDDAVLPARYKARVTKPKRNRTPTGSRGVEHFAAKLTVAQVYGIRAMGDSGASAKATAEKYGCSEPNAWKIMKRILWKSLPEKA